MFPIARYYIKNERLIPWVKFIWCFTIEHAEIHHKLLPTDSIDLILNLSSDMIYKTESHEFTANHFHVNGLRNKHSYIIQRGIVRIFGISFYSFGLYPFVHKSLLNVQNKIVDLNVLSKTLAQKLALAVTSSENDNVVINIENSLCSELQINQDDINNSRLIKQLMESNDNITIQSFCKEHGLNLKTFERMVLRYTGYSPKILRRIRRFQAVCNQLVHQTPECLSDLAYDYGFADQSHLIKEFQKFSDEAPRAFHEKKVTIKENVRYSHI